MKKKLLLIFLLFVIINLIPHVYVALNLPDSLLNWYLTDDAFYYFKTAQNITEGRGITFDGLAPTNGFHPLWMLVCVPVFALARFNLFLPLRVLIIVQALLNAVSGYLLFRLFADHLSEKAGWLVAIFWMFLPAIHGITTKLGVESGLNAFTLIFLFYQVSRLADENEGGSLAPKNILWISLAAILVLFSRLDNIFILVMLGIWLVFRKSQMRWLTQADFLLILISALTSYFLRIQATDNIFNFLPFAYLLIAFSLIIKPLCLYFFGLYKVDSKETVHRMILKMVAALSLASILIAFIFFILYDLLEMFRGISRAVLILDWFVSLSLLTLIRIFIYRRQNNSDEMVDISFKTNWQIWLGRACAYFVPLFTMLAAYMLVNKLYAGSAMPVSGQIKRWWGTLPNTVYGRPIKTLSGVVAGLFDTSMESGPFWLITKPLSLVSRWLGKVLGVASASTVSSFMLVVVWIIFLAVLLAILYGRWRGFTEVAQKFALLPFFSGCFFHVISYKASGYLHTKYWYWPSEMILLTIFFGILLSLLLNEMEKQKSKKWMANGLVAVAIFALLTGFGYTILRDFPLGKDAPKLYDYQADQEIIESQTEAGDVIGMTGGGVTAYFIPDRTFINLDGLINNATYFQSLRDGTVNEYFETVGLKYIFGEEAVLLDSDPYRWIFTDHLQIQTRGSMFNLYRYCGVDCQ